MSTQKRNIQPIQQDQEQLKEDVLDLTLPPELEAAPYYSITSPHMPPAGQDILTLAHKLGCPNTKLTRLGSYVLDGPSELVDKIYKYMLRRPGLSLPIDYKKQKVTVTTVTGHLWGEHFKEWQRSFIDSTAAPLVSGPYPADVMVIDHYPRARDIAELRQFTDLGGQVFFNTLKDSGVKGFSRWYITTLLKFNLPQGAERTTAAWVKDCLPLLMNELRIVRPKFVICFNSQIIEAIYQLNKQKLIYLADELSFTVHVSDTEKFEIKVIPMVSPWTMAYNYTTDNLYLSSLHRTLKIVNNNVKPVSVDFRTIETLEDAAGWAEEVKKKWEEEAEENS
jgi:uracil-DNA glycosylase family 4